MSVNNTLATAYTYALKSPTLEFNQFSFIKIVYYKKMFVSKFKIKERQ